MTLVLAIGKMLKLSPSVFLTVRRHWLSIRVVPHRGEAVQLEGMARLAVRHIEKGGTELAGTGEEATAFANDGDVTVHDAFCHPRVLIGGFDEAELVVRTFLRQAFGGKSPVLPFPMVIYIAEELEGGLTDIEERAFKQLGFCLGAGSVSVELKP